MLERHQDYQLTVPSVPVGGLVNFPLQLDTDAPFALSLVKTRNININGFRFQTPSKNWQSSGLRTDYNYSNQAGSELAWAARGVVVHPEMIYPVGSQIVVDIGNATNAPLVNARILFRGRKLFRDGAIHAPSYPPRISPIPFTYGVVVQNVGLATSPTNPWVQRDVQLHIRQDGDFAYRYGVADPFTVGVEGGFATNPGPLGVGTTYDEVYVQIKDESRKAYSNEPIHINDLFGQANPDPSIFGLLQNDPGVGPQFPGLVVPEIYLEREHSMYFDVYRYDQTGFPVDIHFRFGGAKVFKQ